MARNFFNYVNYSYSGGLNNTDEPDQISENEASTLQNAYIGKKGQLTKRSGALLVGDDTGATAITGKIGWIEDDGTKWLIRTSGTEIQYLNSTTWDAFDDGFTDDLATEFVIANNKLYIFNGTDDIHSWDGADVNLNSGVTDMGGSIPSAKFGVFWKNYMFITGSTALSGTSYPSRVYFSNLNDPDTFTTGTDYFDVNKSDGQDITGIKPLGELLVIFKRRSYYILSGSSPGDWRISTSVNNVQSVDSSVGCTSHRSIVQVGNDLWFMSDDGMRSVRRTEAQSDTPSTGIVSGKIEGTIAGMNKSALDKVCAVQFNKRVYYAYPTGSSTFNDEVSVSETRQTAESITNPHPWVTYTGWNVSCWATHLPGDEPVLYYGEASDDSLSFQAETGTNDNSASIDFDYQSPMIDLRQPDMKKTYRFLKVSAKTGDSDNTVTIQSSSDANIFTTHGTLDLYDGGTQWNSATWDTDTWAYIGQVKDKFPIARASEQLMVRFRNNNADQPVTMYPYTMAIKTKKVK